MCQFWFSLFHFLKYIFPGVPLRKKIGNSVPPYQCPTSLGLFFLVICWLLYYVLELVTTKWTWCSFGVPESDSQCLLRQGSFWLCSLPSQKIFLPVISRGQQQQLLQTSQETQELRVKERWIFKRKERCYHKI